MPDNVIIKGRYDNNNYNDLRVLPDGSTNHRILVNNGTEVSVQNPFPCDGDSVYVKDLDIDYCDNGDFSGSITDYFDSLKSINSNTTTNNPKIIKLWFKRTIYSHAVGLGCDDLDSNFGSSITVKLLGSGGSVRYTKTYTGLDGNSALLEFGSIAFNGVQIEFNTSNTACLSNITISKSTETRAQLHASSDLTNNIENIKSYRNALQVDTALVHEKGVNLFFFRELEGNTTVDIQAEIDDTILTVVDASPFSVGDKIRVTTDVDVGQSFLYITAITGNVLTIDRPFSSVITAGQSVQKISTSLNVAGSLDTPVIFKIKPPNSILSLRWQLTRILISISDETSMDDGRFGSLPHLTNGVNIRIVKGNDNYRDITNWKDNGDMAEDMFDIVYTSKAPSGEYGLRGRWTFTKAQFHIDLKGANSDYLELRVQDDLSTLSDFKIKAQGRLFGG